MPRVLGVSCASAEAYLTVLDVDQHGTEALQAVGSERIRVVQAGDHGEELARTLLEWERQLDTITPDAVALLLPGGGDRTKRLHSQWAPRCEVETIVGLASGRKRVPFDSLHRATVRSRLGLSGSLDDTVKTLPTSGKYWKDRGLAFLAARAVAAHAAAADWPERSGSDRQEGDDAPAR